MKRKRKHPSKGQLTKKVHKSFNQMCTELTEDWWSKEIEAVDSMTLHFKATHKTSMR